ncbi:MAG: hypothetical protein LBI99_04275 [Propionibacteriaceae bacterium]|jgi:hypothetical protein|nr:hypothetical protein [Propionibacteriaceae bacterium]
MLVIQKPKPGEQPRFPEHVKGVWVPDSLDTLRGPTVGEVELPLHLDWTPANHYDLSQPRRVQTMYRTVLCEARRPDDVDSWLDRDTLVRLWPQLKLPWFVRQPWEHAHPELV